MAEDKMSGMYWGVWLDDLKIEHIEAMDAAYAKGYDDGYVNGIRDSIRAVGARLEQMRAIAEGDSDVAG